MPWLGCGDQRATCGIRVSSTMLIPGIKLWPLGWQVPLQTEPSHWSPIVTIIISSLQEGELRMVKGLDVDLVTGS